VTERVLLLAPSRDLGGGIERFVSTIESAFAEQLVPYERLDLVSQHRRPAAAGKLRFAAEVAHRVRASDYPVRLVLAHPHLAPVLYPVARLANFAGATVVVHGIEAWSGGRLRGRRALRRSDVRVVAGSAYTAGALATTCPATVLNPAVPAGWYETLVDAGDRAATAADGIRLLTAFRLADWRNKGLETLVRAVQLVGDERVRLTVCGTGPVPADLSGLVRQHRWCRLAGDLSDRSLAEEFARADLFVLATRTRSGARACGEGFGLVLLEAQLAGTPVVAPAYGGSTDAFQRGITGLAPIDETPEALASVLRVLVTDGALRSRMAQAAVAWSRARFEPVAYSKQVVRAMLGSEAVGEGTCAASVG
jgi:phosphatidylinositol alpha-1,6-mannosyltransferase